MNKINLLITLLLFIVSCNTLKLDRKRINKIDNRHPEVIAEICNKNFKDIDSITEVIKYLPGEPIIVKHFVKVNLDSLIKTLQKDTVIKFINIECPPSTYVVDTFYKEKNTSTVNKAELFICQKKIDSSTQEILKFKSLDLERQKEIAQKEIKIQQKNKKLLILSGILVLIFIWTILKTYIKRII